MIPFPELEFDVNVEHEQILEQIRANIRRSLPQFWAGGPGLNEVIILGGGASLNEPDVHRELIDLYHRGVPLIALNGAGNWAYEQNLMPKRIMMVDARNTDENRAMIGRVPCPYLLASQVHQDVVHEALSRDREVTLCHPCSGPDSPPGKLLTEYYGEKRWQPVPACGFVGLTAIVAMAMSGYGRQHIFGLDSCYTDFDHHAYEQAQNDTPNVHEVLCGGESFLVTSWMVSQQRLFCKVVKHYGDFFRLQFYGRGLLAHTLKTGADALQET